jgi:1-acyl-sn-glycerol-3-phosphate acyltransferase
VDLTAPVTVDGFVASDADAFGGYRPEVSASFMRRVDRVAERLGVELDGIDNLPAGRALLVANHAFGWDVVFAMAAIRLRTGRPVFALGDHLWWKTPFLRRVAAAVGTVDGTPRNVDRLLSADQLVLVLPGGIREAVKPSALRYRLMWGERYGFVRAALRNRSPVVPLAALGADEIFDFIGDAIERGRRVLGPIGLGAVPLPRPSGLIPWPHRVHLRYVVGEPVSPLFGPECADDPRALRTMRLLVEGALHELLDRELALRAHISMGRDR